MQIPNKYSDEDAAATVACYLAASGMTEGVVNIWLRRLPDHTGWEWKAWQDHTYEAILGIVTYWLSPDSLIAQER